MNVICILHTLHRCSKRTAGWTRVIADGAFNPAASAGDQHKVVLPERKAAAQIAPVVFVQK